MLPGNFGSHWGGIGSIRCSRVALALIEVGLEASGSAR